MFCRFKGNRVAQKSNCPNCPWFISWVYRSTTNVMCNYAIAQTIAHCKHRVLMLQVPFFICRYLLLNIQVPFSTRQQAIRGTVLFTPDLLTPHTAFTSIPTTVPVFWNVSTHFSTHVHTQSLPRPRDVTQIDENWTLTKRRVRHLERTVLGRYLLSCHTVSIHTTKITGNSWCAMSQSPSDDRIGEGRGLRELS